MFCHQQTQQARGKNRQGETGRETWNETREWLRNVWDVKTEKDGRLTEGWDQKALKQCRQKTGFILGSSEIHVRCGSRVKEGNAPRKQTADKVLGLQRSMWEGKQKKGGVAGGGLETGAEKGESVK